MKPKIIIIFQLITFIMGVSVFLIGQYISVDNFFIILSHILSSLLFGIGIGIGIGTTIEKE